MYNLNIRKSLQVTEIGWQSNGKQRNEKSIYIKQEKVKNLLQSKEKWKYEIKIKDVLNKRCEDRGSEVERTEADMIENKKKSYEQKQKTGIAETKIIMIEKGRISFNIIKIE